MKVLVVQLMIKPFTKCSVCWDLTPRRVLCTYVHAFYVNILQYELTFIRNTYDKVDWDEMCCRCMRMTWTCSRDRKELQLAHLTCFYPHKHFKHFKILLMIWGVRPPIEQSQGMNGDCCWGCAATSNAHVVGLLTSRSTRFVRETD